MNIQITKQTEEYINGSLYCYTNLQVDAKAISMLCVSGKSNYVNVMVKNAAHKAYAGLGKQFKSITEACESYKDAKIVAMLTCVKINATVAI